MTPTHPCMPYPIHHPPSLPTSLATPTLQALQAAPFGHSLVWTCGYIYEQKALQALGGIESVGAALEQRGHTAVQQVRVAGSAIKTFRAVRKEQKVCRRRP